MNMPNASAVMEKLKGWECKLCSMKVKDNLDFSMTVTSKNDGGSDAPCFEKRITSNTEFELVKLVWIVALVGTVIGVICAIAKK